MGRLNRLIEVQKFTVSRDSFGGERQGGWVTLAQVWAERLTWKPKQKFVQGSARFVNISTSSFKIHQRDRPRRDDASLRRLRHRVEHLGAYGERSSIHDNPSGTHGMKLPRLFGNLSHEHRESATDAIVAALVAQAGGSSVPPSVEALGAVEAAAGLWSRAFASATVEPQTTTTMSLTPSVLAAIGRALAVRGEAVFALDVDGAVILLTQASDMEGGGRYYVRRRGATPLSYPCRPVRWSSEHSSAMRCYTSDMQRGQVRPGPVSLPSAWPSETQNPGDVD